MDPMPFDMVRKHMLSITRLAIGKKNGKYYSTGNRRLKVFKMLQDEYNKSFRIT